MHRVAVGVVFLAVAAVLAAPAFAFDEVFHQVYPLSPDGSFQLQNVNGSVVISGWERNEVEVYAVKSARHNPSDLARVHIEVAARASAVTVDTRYPHDDGVEVTVEYRIRVPHRVLLNRVATVNGAVRVSGVESAGELRSVNGNIEVYDSAGRLHARTTNGDVRLELRWLDPGGPLSVETVNGSVVLALPANVGAELDVRSLNGDFRSELPVTVQGSLDSREFRGRLGPGGSALRIRTVNGSIRLVSARPTV